MSFAPEAASWAESLVAGQFRHLFDAQSGTMLFAKDAQYRLMLGNAPFVERCGFDHEVEIIGRTDDRIFPPSLAEKYRADDELVLRTGEARLGLIELFPNANGKPEWYVTDKVPLFDRAGQITGLCGTVRSYEGQRAALAPYLELAAVAEHLKDNFRKPLDVNALAAIAGLSVRQFTRRFRATFQMTPRAYLIKTRVLRACELLSRSNFPVTQIALEAGFYDHSDFARQFKRHMGQTASSYRANAKADTLPHEL
ncbi:MAG: helix-turn-helix domain-containing protein [Myxococcota bacterium]